MRLHDGHNGRAARMRAGEGHATRNSRVIRSLRYFMKVRILHILYLRALFHGGEKRRPPLGPEALKLIKNDTRCGRKILPQKKQRPFVKAFVFDSRSTMVVGFTLFVQSVG